jgi:hypothetical protein
MALRSDIYDCRKLRGEPNAGKFLAEGSVGIGRLQFLDFGKLRPDLIGIIRVGRELQVNP